MRASSELRGSGCGDRRRQGGIDRVRQVVVVLGHAAVGEIAVQARAAAEVPSAGGADLVELVLGRAAGLAVAVGEPDDDRGPAIDRGVRVLPAEAALVVVEQRGVVREAELLLLVAEAHHRVEIVAAVVDGLGDQHRARIAAAVADHRAEGLVAVAVLVAPAAAEVPVLARGAVEAEFEASAQLLEVDLVEAVVELGHARGGLRPDPVARQALDPVRTGAGIDRAGAVGAIDRDLVVACVHPVLALHPALHADLARVEAEVGRGGTPPAGDLAVPRRAAADVEVQDAVDALLLEPGVLAELERGVADVAGADLDPVALHLEVGIRFLGRLVGEGGLVVEREGLLLVLRDDARRRERQQDRRRERRHGPLRDSGYVRLECSCVTSLAERSALSRLAHARRMVAAMHLLVAVEAALAEQLLRARRRGRPGQAGAAVGGAGMLRGHVALLAQPRPARLEQVRVHRAVRAWQSVQSSRTGACSHRKGPRFSWWQV